MDRQQLAGTVFWVILLLAAAAPFYLRDHGRRRNRAGRCARCAARLPWEERFRVEGLLLCSACAQRTRGRVLVAVIVLVVLGLLSSLFGIVLAVSLRVEGDPSWWLALVIMGGCGLGLILLTLFALWRMKADNTLSSASERAMFLIRLLGFDKIRSEKNKPFGGGA